MMKHHGSGATDDQRYLRYSRVFYFFVMMMLKVALVTFLSHLRPPAEWNSTSKKYIMDNISKMSKLAQGQIFWIILMTDIKKQV